MNLLERAAANQLKKTRERKNYQLGIKLMINMMYTQSR